MANTCDLAHSSLVYPRRLWHNGEQGGLRPRTLFGQTMPAAQRRLWRLLRDRRFAGHKFRPERPIGPYFLDFYCAEAKLNLELDGGQHGFPEQHRRDQSKKRYLLSRGIVTRRFWNWQVRWGKGAPRGCRWAEADCVVYPTDFSASPLSVW